MEQTWSERLSGRISQRTVDETVERKGELIAAGRYSGTRRISADIDVEKTDTVLGRGATGKVQLATRPGGRKVAVKSVLKNKLSKSAKALLMNEAGLYLSLDHPHIAKLEQVYESRRELHFVMEHLEGGELLQRLKTGGKFSEKQAAEAMRQMLLAVAYLHAHQIAHRDLKPENFVYDKADGQHIKMIDFGFASRFTDDTRMSQPCGSLHYVAPEVLTKSYTEKADLWSMGCIAYTMLCGRSPWHPYKDSRKETMRKVTKGDVFYCPERFSSLSLDAQDFVRALFTFDPKARLSAAQALQHPWIQNMAATNADLDLELAQKIRRVEQVAPFRRLCLSMAAWQLSSQDTEELRKQFHAMDADNDGVLSLDEFREALGDDGPDVEEVFACADLGKDGEIGFTSFVVAAMEQRPQLETLRLVFNRLDADRNGKITARDLLAVFGPTFEGHTMHDLIKEVDSSDGLAITWHAFSCHLLGEAVDMPESDMVDVQRTCFLKEKLDKLFSLISHPRICF